MIWMGTGQNGDKFKTATTKTATHPKRRHAKTASHPKRRQPKRRHTKTATRQNGDTPKRRHIQNGDNQNGDIPKRRHAKTATHQNGGVGISPFWLYPKRRHAKTATKPKRRRWYVAVLVVSKTATRQNRDKTKTTTNPKRRHVKTATIQLDLSPKCIQKVCAIVGKWVRVTINKLVVFMYVYNNGLPQIHVSR